MSTRANYIFKQGNRKVVNYYIHHDGYPEGAAIYFQNALIQGNGKIKDAADFARANDKCYVTDAIHGDIEYLYEFNMENQWLRVYKVWNGIQQLFLRMPIYEFINKYYTVFSSNPLYKKYMDMFTYKGEKGVEKRIKEENYWVQLSKADKNSWNCLLLVYEQMKENNTALIERGLEYGMDNPNYETLREYELTLIYKYETILKALREA